MLVSTVAILREDAPPPVPDEEKATFYATADLGLEVRYLFLGLAKFVMY
jgi:hypothetical protein